MSAAATRRCRTSAFVPAALLGADAGMLLDRAREMARPVRVDTDLKMPPSSSAWCSGELRWRARQTDADCAARPRQLRRVARAARGRIAREGRARASFRSKAKRPGSRTCTAAIVCSSTCARRQDQMRRQTRLVEQARARGTSGRAHRVGRSLCAWRGILSVGVRHRGRRSGAGREPVRSARRRSRQDRDAPAWPASTRRSGKLPDDDAGMQENGHHVRCSIS